MTLQEAMKIVYVSANKVKLVHIVCPRCEMENTLSHTEKKCQHCGEELKK